MQFSVCFSFQLQYSAINKICFVTYFLLQLIKDGFQWIFFYWNDFFIYTYIVYSILWFQELYNDGQNNAIAALIAYT